MKHGISNSIFRVEKRLRNPYSVIRTYSDIDYYLMRVFPTFTIIIAVLNNMERIASFYYGGSNNPIVVDEEEEIKDRRIKDAFKKTGLKRKVEMFWDSQNDANVNFDVAFVGKKRRFIKRQSIIDVDSCLKCKTIYGGFGTGWKTLQCHSCLSDNVAQIQAFCRTEVEEAGRDVETLILNKVLELTERDGCV